ncbi:MAG TPA: MBL fold metallo-hydrolase [Actinomycetota bacterium]|nr:MBL fold metallo-hydrolase [Actinomycetota bacterium]
MRTRIWGCRGSLATPGPGTVRYGGNTSCIEVRLSDGTLLVLDAGTGTRPLGLALDGAGPRRIDVLLTHLHLDHLEGLGFFGPLWDPSVELHVWGPPSPVRPLRERIATYLSPPLFPVRLAEVPAALVLHDVPHGPFPIGPATVSGVAIVHRGPTVGYRIEEGGRILAYLTDHEPALGADLARTPPHWVSGYPVAAGADLLIHDCQYTEEEYPPRAGWGHSSTEHVAAFARLAGVRRLVLFHHDPLHDDDQLERMLKRVRELWPEGEVELAREGAELEV